LTIFNEANQETLILAQHNPDGRICVIQRFSFGIFSFCRVLDSRNFIKRQPKTFHTSPFTCLYEFHFVQIFETNGHQFSLKSSIGISKEWSTSKSSSRFSSGVKSVKVTAKGVAVVIEEKVAFSLATEEEDLESSIVLLKAVYDKK